MPNPTIYTHPTNQPQGRSQASEFEFREKSYFTLLHQEEIPDFWEMIITDVNEQFSEGESRINVLSDTFMSFATGAHPIQVSISGWLYVSEEQDHRVDFLNLYEHYFRGSAVSRSRKEGEDGWELQFMLKHTYFKLNLMNCQVQDTVTVPDFTKISLTGTAYDYGSLYVEAPDETGPEAGPYSAGLDMGSGYGNVV